MSNEKGKITVRQAFLLFLVLVCAPAIRYIPIYTVQEAKEAAWITPITGLILELIYFCALMSIHKKYPTKSFVDVIKDIMGKFLGSIICITYFFWMIFVLTFNTKMFVQRIISTALPNVNVVIILFAMLIIVAYILKSGIVPLAKMNEIFFILLGLVFFVYNLLIIPEIKIDNVYPITLDDALPVCKGTIGIIAIFAYNILILMFNDKIEDKGNFKKSGLKTLIILAILNFFVIIIPLSVFGWSVLVKMPIPYLNTMMQISLFQFIERIEAGIVMFWIITDFVMISTFIYTILHMTRIFFKIENTRPLINIFTLMIFFLVLGISQSSFELKILSENAVTPSNVIMGYCLPLVIFAIGKIRRKI